LYVPTSGNVIDAYKYERRERLEACGGRCGEALRDRRAGIEGLREPLHDVHLVAEVGPAVEQLAVHV